MFFILSLFSCNFHMDGFNIGDQYEQFNQQHQISVLEETMIRFTRDVIGVDDLFLNIVRSSAQDREHIIQNRRDLFDEVIRRIFSNLLFSNTYMDFYTTFIPIRAEGSILKAFIIDNINIRDLVVFLLARIQDLERNFNRYYYNIRDNYGHNPRGNQHDFNEDRERFNIIRGIISFFMENFIQYFMANLREEFNEFLALIVRFSVLSDEINDGHLLQILSTYGHYVSRQECLFIKEQAFRSGARAIRFY